MQNINRDDRMVVAVGERVNIGAGLDVSPFLTVSSARSARGGKNISRFKRSICSAAFVALFVMVSALSSGCIAIRKDLVPMAEPVKPLPAGVSAVPVTLQFTVKDRNGNRFTGESQGLFGCEHKVWEAHRRRFDEEAKESGLFTVVGATENKQAVDFQITAKQYMSFWGDVAVTLSVEGLSPTWPDVHQEVLIVVRTSGGKTFRYDMKDELVQINWLPLMIAAPFKPAISDYNAVVRNLYRSAFLKMQEDGVLPKDKPLAQASPADVAKRQAELDAQEAKQRREEAVLLREVFLPGHVKLESLRCPAGTFTMGSPAEETGHRKDETQHQVTLTKPFWVGKTEVTQAQWRALMGDNPSKFKSDDLPVETVSSCEAEAFCRKLTERFQVEGLTPSGYAWRLPTEAEWEYACRAGSAGVCAGSDRLDDLAWYGVNSDKKTRSVGQKKPNAWGLCDMLGNVSEWCLDMYEPYSPSAALDPVGPELAPNLGRVYRGGSWNLMADRCRSAVRSSTNRNGRYAHVGFRVVLAPVIPSRS